MFAPELSQLHEKGREVQISFEIGERLTPFATESIMMSRGQSQQESSVLKLEEPGYYQVFVVVEDLDEDNLFTEDGAYIDLRTLKHFWIWYDGKNMETTNEFEHDRFSESVVINNGPFVQKGEEQRILYYPEIEIPSVYSRSSHTIRVVYTDPVTMSVRPLVDAKVISQNVDTSMDIVLNEITVRTDSNGETSTHCYDPIISPPGYEKRIRTYTENSVSEVVNQSNSSFVGARFDPPCGQQTTINASVIKSHAFTWINESAEVGDDILNRTRSQVEVKTDPNANNSYYSPGPDRIVLSEDHLDGAPFGNFVIAHEYGHAFHRKALDVTVPGNCPSDHFFDGAHNLQCAYIEGFGNYYGVITVNNIYRTLIANNSFYPGDSDNGDGDPNDGSIIEGAVAAFLYDITDPENESHDDVDYPGNYLSQVIESCEVQQSFIWLEANGIDHIIACLEEQIPSYTNYFDTRSAGPNNFSVTSTKPSGWNQSDIENLWKYNLYGEN